MSNGNTEIKMQDVTAMTSKRFGSWSAGEKLVMVKLTPPAPELEHPLRKRVNRDGGEEMVYDLEGDTGVLLAYWPFKNWKPGLDDNVYDVHSRRLYRFRDSKMIRLEGRNILVCEDYLETGGMACDMEPESILVNGRPTTMFTADATQKNTSAVLIVLGGAQGEKNSNGESGPQAD